MIKKILLIFGLCLISTLAFGQRSKSIAGEGRFYAKNEDSLRFIKSQLLHSAFSDVITKELKYLGLDPSQFWKSYDEKFDLYFEPIKQQLQKKYSMDNNPSLKKRQRFTEVHRQKRLKLKAKYGKLDQAITSYSIKKMTRSAQIPNSRYINVNARINRKLLKKIYFSIISDSIERTVRTIYVSAIFNINDLAWSEVGVELENDFTDVIKRHWKKWLTENLKTSFGEVVLTDPTKEKDLTDFSKAPKEVTAEILVDSGNIEEEPQPINEYKDGLWLKLSISLKKVKEEFLMKERTFSLSGDFLLIDLNSGKVVDSFDMPILKNKYSFDKGAPLSTNLATWVYRIASSEFRKFDEKIAAIPFGRKTVDLNIYGTQTFLDFEKVGELLSIRGASQRFSSKIISYKGSTGRMELKYSGDKENLLTTLNSLGHMKIDEFRTLEKVVGDDPFSFRLTAISISESDKPMKDESRTDPKAKQ